VQAVATLSVVTQLTVTRAFLRSAQDRLCPGTDTDKMIVPI